MKKKILIVDDDESILDAVSIVLESQYDVATTLKGEEIYTKVNEFHPDLIILDVLMSGNDGRTICKKLKNDDTTKTIPILMTSAHPSAREGTNAAGADTFLAKPFGVQELLEKVAAML